MTRIRHRVSRKLHHSWVVDLAPLNWNVSIGVLCRGAWNMFFCGPFLSSNAYRRTAPLQPTTRWRLTVWSWGSLYMLTCYYFFNLEIHSLLEDTTVNTESRRKGHCEGMSVLSSLYVCCMILQRNFGVWGLTLKPLQAKGSLRMLQLKV